MNQKLGLGILHSVKLDALEQLSVFKKAGFDAFFSQWGDDDTKLLREKADELGLEYQSIHAPFVKMRHMWYQSGQTEIAKQELISCIDEAAEYNVPIVVVHPFIGFDVNEANEFGIENFKNVVEDAKKKGIKIAFENVEGDAYLEALMSAFCNYHNVGFCWDTGHEMCYNRGKDMLALYGNRLIATHINDNMGVRGENITFHDDMHMLPFDGIKDWQDAMDRLDKCGYSEIMTFELKIDLNIDKEYSTGYSTMSFEEYVKEAYNRACKLRQIRIEK